MITRIRNGLLLPMTDTLPIIENGAVLIRDGVIRDWGRTSSLMPEPAELDIDAKGGIIMPGLVNCHTHAPMTMFRGMADDLPLDIWLNDHIFPAEAKQLNPETVKKWSLHAFREMLLSGTTTCCDGYFYEQQVAQAMGETGIRGIAGQGVVDFPAPGVPDPSDNIGYASRFVDKIRDRYALVQPAIFCHSPYTCSADTLVKGKQAAREKNVLFQVHAAETRDEARRVDGIEGRSVIQYLFDLGILDAQTLLVHTVWIDGHDIDLIRKSGARVAHAPESNMKLASGIAPVPRLLSANVPVGLGTDGCASNNDHDMFAEMDMAAKLHKVATLDPCAMDARTTVKMATIEGARVLGLSGVTGSIETGKQADIIVLDTDKYHMQPLYDPYSSLVYAAKAADVSLVMVGGKILVRDGKLV